METEWRIGRVQLREQLIDNPQSSHELLAHFGWVKLSK